MKNGKLNYSILDIGGSILAGNPDKAVGYYEGMITEFEKLGLPVERGVFGAHMHVDLLNDGPVLL